MNSHPSKKDLPDLDLDLENDALWNLLQDATPSEASPRFAQDTLRRIHLERAIPKAPWWKSLLAPKPHLIAAGAGVAALVIFTSLPSPPPSPPNTEVANTTSPIDDWNELEHAVASELLSDAAEDPSLLSDEEILALLF